MRKTRVFLDAATQEWLVMSPCMILGASAKTRAEAMRLACFLADPDEYVRRLRENVWEEGYAAGDHDGAGTWSNFDVGITENPYKRESD